MYLGKSILINSIIGRREYLFYRLYHEDAHRRKVEYNKLTESP
jgi:hypothetical protein